MIKKIFLPFILIVSALFSSCGFQDEYSGDSFASRPSLNSTTEEENEISFEKDPLGELEGYDYGGRTFTIVTTDSEYFSPQDKASLIANAVLDRNGMVETKYNVSIVVRNETPEEIIDNAVVASKNGEKYADIIVAPANVLAQLVEKKCLLNLNVLPYLDKESGHINKKLWEQSQLNGKTYMFFSSLTQTEFSPWCVFYNKMVSSQIGINPIELYEKGQWTWETFLEYSSQATEILKNGFVTTSTKNDFSNILWATTGNEFFAESHNSSLKVPKAENGKEVLSNIRKIINHKSYGMKHGVEALDSFTEGEAAMLLCRRDAVYKICDSGMSWGVVPMPKYNDDSKHCSFIDGEALAVSAFKNAEDTEFLGRVLNALVLASEKTVSESITTNEIYYYWADNQTALNMEEMKKYVCLDIGIIYAYAIKDVAVVTTENIVSSLESGIAPFQFYHSTKRQFELFAHEYFG